MKSWPVSIFKVRFRQDTVETPYHLRYIYQLPLLLAKLAHLVRLCLNVALSHRRLWWTCLTTDELSIKNSPDWICYNFVQLVMLSFCVGQQKQLAVFLPNKRQIIKIRGNGMFEIFLFHLAKAMYGKFSITGVVRSICPWPKKDT